MFFVVVILAVGLLLSPFILQTPDTLRKVVYPLKYEAAIRQASQEHGLEPAFVAGVVYTESRFRPEAESSQGALGLMQVMPETAAFVQERSGVRGDYQDPRVNLQMGTWYLSYLSEKYEEYERHDRLTLAAYNSGQGRVDGWISQEGFDIERDIPFEETRAYVDNVLEARGVYRDLYGEDLSGD